MHNPVLFQQALQMVKRTQHCVDLFITDLTIEEISQKAIHDPLEHLDALSHICRHVTRVAILEIARLPTP